MMHTKIANARIAINGNRFSNRNVLSVISLYPHEAGKIFPTVSNAFGSSSVGNIIPESMIEGKKTIIETIEVIAWSFTAKPIMLARLSDTPMKIARVIKYRPGLSGILALKASGAAKYRITLIINELMYAEMFVNMRPRYSGTPFAL